MNTAYVAKPWQTWTQSWLLHAKPQFSAGVKPRRARDGGVVGSAGGFVGHRVIPGVIVIEAAGKMTVDNVDDGVGVDAAGGNVVVLLSKQIGQSPHCISVSSSSNSSRQLMY